MATKDSVMVMVVCGFHEIFCDQEAILRPKYDYFSGFLDLNFKKMVLRQQFLHGWYPPKGNPWVCTTAK